MNLKKNKSGFTLLEIIIVIIIVGVLASLALPRLFATVEFSKSAEALASLSVIRQSIERCYLATADYTNCDVLTTLDVEDPAGSPGARFTYAISGAIATAGYTITATRNSVDGGDSSSMITLTQTATGVTRAGSGTYAGIK